VEGVGSVRCLASPPIIFPCHLSASLLRIEADSGFIRAVEEGRGRAESKQERSVNRETAPMLPMVFWEWAELLAAAEAPRTGGRRTIQSFGNDTWRSQEKNCRIELSQKYDS
jgi:hypothetical protein